MLLNVEQASINLYIILSTMKVPPTRTIKTPRLNMERDDVEKNILEVMEIYSVRIKVRNQLTFPSMLCGIFLFAQTSKKIIVFSLVLPL